MIKKALQKLGIGGKKKKNKFSPADVPLGDGLINREKVKIQSKRMKELDVMLREGFITQEEYNKQKFRIMGSKKK
jgi:hypothetical protein|tara:strand:+ start:336 stop:560 length:225 start_codon:yes stop_codon:yes gene_type:complete